ncbi:MAG: NFACT family protein [Candidatus Thermoplasmatota archaeon]|nr:NFACT family protein [Candidatus Thermoplasmatota archaeon]
MKKALTGPDIRELVSEWQYLLGCRLEQFGRPSSNELILKFRSSRTGTIRLVVDLSGWGYVTKESISTESNQGVFVNAVRKTIKKSRLETISQLNGDRIICLEFIRGDESHTLIFEMFHKGNAILCSDGNIKTVMRQQKFKHRSLKPGLEYLAPPGFNPFESGFSKFSEAISGSERPIGASLTIDCNLGGEISNLACHRLEIDVSTKIEQSKFQSIYDQVEAILSDKIRPSIFLDDGGKNFTVSSFNLSHLRQGPQFDTFSEAIETYLNSREEPILVVEDKEDMRIIRQKQAIDNYLSKAKKLREKGNLIFSNVGLVKNAIKNEKDTIQIENKEFKIDISKSPEANASDYFDKAKEMERKAKRTREILNTKPLKKPRRKKIKAENLEWFENYRWFITSEGEVAIGGKDSTTNERAVKKYLKNMDRYAHADVHGAPSVVVKNNGTPPSSDSMLEACHFSLAYSKAWAARVSSGHSFWVESDKVSKTPNTGEFLAKGSFVIRGKRNWNKNLELKLAIGLVDYNGVEKLMGGPVMALENQSKKYAVFKPGFTDRKNLSKLLSNIFERDISEIEKLLPNGGFKLVKSSGIDIKLE